MKTIGTFAVLSFIALAVFGFLALGHHENENGWKNCMISLAGGGFCFQDNAFALAIFHIDFLKSFSRAAIPLLVLAAFLLVVFAFSPATSASYPGKSYGKKLFVSSFLKPLPPLRYRFLDWSSVLRENIAA